MELHDLPTPFVAVDVERLNSNIRRFSEMAKESGKMIFPMVKTHKSSKIAFMQKKAGSDGFTVGTIDEARATFNAGIKDPILMGYPISDIHNIRRIIKLVNDGANVILRFDTFENAKLMNSMLEEEKLEMDYTVKVDVGGRRLGLKPDLVGKFTKKLMKLRNLNFRGIVTHPANAYHAKNPREVEVVAKQALKCMQKALTSLKDYKIHPEIIGIGSTPTFRFDVEYELYTHLFPGNYVYFDRQQALVFGSASIADCALNVCVSVISVHSEKTGFINAGSLFFDKRKVENSYGEAMEREVYVVELSQEVSKIKFNFEENVRHGEMLGIIPNHSCIASNSVNYLVLHKDKTIKDLIQIDGKTGGVFDEVRVKV